MPEGVPTQKVQQLRGQNLSSSQIIDALQKEGYSSSQIFDALNQDPSMENPPPPPSGRQAPPPPDFPSDLPPMPDLPEPQQNPFDLDAPPAPAQRSQPAPMPQRPAPQQRSFAPTPTAMSNPAPQGQRPGADVSTEEYVEAIIDEKWQDIEEDIQKIVDWKHRQEQRIQQLGQQVDDLKDRFDKLHAALIGKIENYDKNILEVGAELKAMEKVFSKVLPVFTDNVKQLQDVATRLKRPESNNER